MIDLLYDPQVWAAFLALVTLEIVLGIDNLIFISIVSGKLPPEQQRTAQRVGIGLALVFRLALLSVIAWIAGLTTPVFDLGLEGAVNEFGHPSYETEFSWRDIILISGGAFLTWKAVTEIQHKVDPHPATSVFEEKVSTGLAKAIVQIVLLDAVFSVDSILTAIGMTEHLPVMVAAVIIAVGVMFVAAAPVTNFVSANPSVVMLALAFLLMIGMVLIADGFGRHIPKGYIYAAMAFAVFVETLNWLSRRRRDRLAQRAKV